MGMGMDNYLVMAAGLHMVAACWRLIRSLSSAFRPLDMSIFPLEKLEPRVAKSGRFHEVSSIDITAHKEASTGLTQQLASPCKKARKPRFEKSKKPAGPQRKLGPIKWPIDPAVQMHTSSTLGTPSNLCKHGREWYHGKET
jgi:hypothetical protein